MFATIALRRFIADQKNNANVGALVKSGIGIDTVGVKAEVLIFFFHNLRCTT